MAYASLACHFIADAARSRVLQPERIAAAAAIRIPPPPVIARRPVVSNLLLGRSAFRPRDDDPCEAVPLLQVEIEVAGCRALQPAAMHAGSAAEVPAAVRVVVGVAGSGECPAERLATGARRASRRDGHRLRLGITLVRGV